MLRSIINFIFFLVLCPILDAASPLVVGMELAYPPFETIDKEGRPSGISVDIAGALGRYLQREIRIENIPFIGLIPSLKSGKIDLIISSMSVTPEREQSISFSNPYMTVGLALLISQKSDLQDVAQADKKGRVIVVKQGTTSEGWAHAHLPQSKVVVLDKESSCILEVVQGKADAFIYDQFSVLRAWQEYPKATRADLHSFSDQNWAVGLRKEDGELKDKVNDFLKKFREEGGFTALADKYLKTEKTAFEKLGIPFPLR